MGMAKEKSMEKERMAGVLMPVASLPSDDGAGSFGEEAYKFVKTLAQTGVKIWQILPLNPLGFGNSPYQPYSSFAGDELYIDIGLLEKEGYLQQKRKPFGKKGTDDHIAYDRVRAYKEPYLKEAYRNFWKKESEQQGFQKFRKMDWVYPYAVFIALKKQNDQRCWNEWPKEQQDWILDRKYDISHLEEEIQYQMFLQYMFFLQWNRLKKYANKNGVRIMGDIPFYVGIDSLDVWQCREDFLLDEDGRPWFIAGVPPDYFSETGQRWGNPIYDWENLEKNNFHFWVKRLKYSCKLYDIIRIDHFRAFDTYWKIPAACETAVDGEWVEAPGYRVFDRVLEELPDIQIVAEDLGDLRDEVLELRDYYHFIGMNIAEFSLLSVEGVKEHQLIYTGTHDNQTVAGWYRDLDEKERKKVRRKLMRFGMPWESVSSKMVRFVYRSRACMAIVPLMDILELDDAARLNTPGTVGSPNWEWRLTDLDRLRRYQRRMRKMIQSSGR